MFVVSVSDRFESPFVLGQQHGCGVATKVAACHRDQVRLIPLDQLTNKLAQPVVFADRDVMKLVDRDQSIIERFDAELFEGEPERRVRANQCLVVRLQKLANRGDLATVGTWRVAQVPARGDIPIGEEAKLFQRRVSEACANRLFRHDHDRLLQPLPM